MNWRPLCLLSAAVVFLGPISAPKSRTPSGPELPDLDVGVPPGTPTSWGQRYPAITPRLGPLFPTTPGRSSPIGGDHGKGKGKAGSGGGTVAQTATVKMDVNISTSFGVVRILTWDLAGHLTWVARTPGGEAGPITGPGGGKVVALPYVNDGLYWANMASLLRLMLHPQMVSEAELIAHLVEIGEPLLDVLDNSVAEKSLAPPSKQIRAKVTAPVGGAAPLPGATPRATMLKRFLATELTRVYPYDPEGGFGSRFFLFADEVEQYLIEYAEKHDGSFLRRNAVSAVGRYRTTAAMAALARLAATTRDPVVLMRALAALSAYQSLPDREPLLARMMAAKDPVEKVAFVAAAGRMGMREAVPYLLELGARRDPDMQLAVVAALARIPHAPDATAVQKFARRVAKTAEKQPEHYRVKARNGPAADIPDTAKTRGEVIHQLALCLQARLGGKGGAEAAAALLAMIAKPRPARREVPPPRRPPAGARPRPARARPRRSNAYANAAMPGVHPPAQMLFVETLRVLGEPGTKALQQIARDASVEPALRGHALAQMPWSARGPIAAAILGDATASDEAKIYAMEIVAKDGHDALEELTRKLLVECGKASAATATAEKRYLWLQALRALDRRGRLVTADVLPLLKHPRVRRGGSEALKQRVRDRIAALVEDAAGGLRPRAKRQRIAAIFDYILATGLNKRLREADRSATTERVLERLAGLEGHKGDTRFKAMVVRDLMTLLTGFRMGLGLRDRAQFRPVVMLEEEILLALGRTRTQAAGDALVAFLEAHPDSPVRAHAALALGMVGKLAFARHLVPLLREDDGFTRFCAYETLRHLTGKDMWADWMYGDETERNLAATHYRKLVGGK